MRSNSNVRRQGRDRLTGLAQALTDCAGADSYLADLDRFVQISTWISDQPDYMSFSPEQMLMLSRIEDMDLINPHS